MSSLVRNSFLAVSVACLMIPAAYAQAPTEWRAIGQYGDKAAPLTVFEKDGALFVDGAGRSSARLRRAGAG
ncbi:MAG: peptidase vanX D-ala-D-ala dipeptidase, partial [Alphaproteobacteria bacterium]|nr:peptidase vanX D-ala-D-ala dipeptidase [Alphaproteobacteria bacterium]